jgi:Protein of unknown function (DUF4230)
VKPTTARALAVAACLAGIVAAFFLGRSRVAGTGGPGDAPAVVTAIRDMARLDATSFHIEKVVEVSEAQSQLWGLVEAKDALLLVAVGDVVAGVDLAALRDADVTVDAPSHTVHLRLPAATVTSATLDERATHVYSRSTDTLARRNEQLEGAARLKAEEQMRQAAIDAGILDRARASVERTLRSLLRALGYENADLDWADRG